MRARKLVKSDWIEIDGRAYLVDYFEGTTEHGTPRYSSEMVLGPGRSHHCGRQLAECAGVARRAADARDGV